MRLIDIENEVKSLAEGNIENPLLYKRIYDLVYYFLRSKRALNYAQDYEEVAAIGADDLYMKLFKGGHITSWLGYINLSHRTYILTYYKKYRSEIIDTTDNPDLADAITVMSASSALQNNSNFDSVLNLSYIGNCLIKSIDEVLDNSPILNYTPEYYTAKMSILLSILNKSFIMFGSNWHDRNYIHLLYVATKDEITKTIGTGTYYLSDVLQQFTLDNINGEDS